jgi:hypothetical protein
MDTRLLHYNICTATAITIGAVYAFLARNIR